MNGRETAMRVAELGQKRFSSLETWFDATRCAGEERLDRRAVGLQEVVHPADAGFPLMWRRS
jgi:hypothetical protein